MKDLTQENIENKVEKNCCNIVFIDKELYKNINIKSDVKVFDIDLVEEITPDEILKNDIIYCLYDNLTKYYISELKEYIDIYALKNKIKVNFIGIINE
jgi:hypothetical protein